MGDNFGVNESMLTCDQQAYTKIFTSIVFDHLEHTHLNPNSWTWVDNPHDSQSLQGWNNCQCNPTAKVIKRVGTWKWCPQHGHVVTLHLIMYVHHLTHTSLTKKKKLMVPNCSKDESIANPIQSNNQSCRTWSGILELELAHKMTTHLTSTYARTSSKMNIRDDNHRDSQLLQRWNKSPIANQQPKNYLHSGNLKLGIPHNMAAYKHTTSTHICISPTAYILNEKTLRFTRMKRCGSNPTAKVGEGVGTWK